MDVPELIQVREASLDEILPLRHRVLRPGRPREAASFEGDIEPTTRHWGLFDLTTNRGLACLSLLRRPDVEQDAWQLRGMAVLPELQGAGLGRQLLREVLAALASERRENPALPTRLWCNARKGAVPFYARCGWSVSGAAFDIPGIGPHFRMHRSLPATQAP
ncbi:MAG: GNAT family N-acetyltransferase [Deltaproteobacteria bacterium]|nr:MAG: GNAT family N-acetyltransferase [Deltaproteobacteria bacterium]